MYTADLQINPHHWGLFTRRKEDPAFVPVRDKVFERDQYTCQFCGFQAREYQEVVNLDKNYKHNVFANMVTACCFCTQCFFIEAVGKQDFGGGKLIYLPEMAQTELNSFCHVLFCAITNGTSYRETAESIYRSLKFRAQPIEDKFGPGMSNPAAMGQMLIENAEKKEGLDSVVLSDLRLLPLYPRFKKQLERWAQAAAEELSSSSG